jgi:glycosyltransferase involved in cell wall biosynthesis
MRILFLTLYPDYQPSTRFRVKQLLPFLDRNIEYKVRTLVPERVFLKYYGKKTFWKKCIFHFYEITSRCINILLSFKYDVVFLQKGITSISYRGFCELIFLFNKNIIFEFDDAITIGPISTVKKFPWVIFRDSSQVNKIAVMSKAVIVGNEKLKDDIRHLNNNIFVIPTAVDTDYYNLNFERYSEKENIKVFWSGNKSGHAYFDLCAQALLRLKEKYKITILVLSDEKDDQLIKSFGEDGFEFVRWGFDSEKDCFLKADIGIMPLYDTLWNRRKCSFKAILYMASGIPVVSSPVGVINEFLSDGENGFLASSSEDWFTKIELLIRDSSLRRKLGLNGRKTVEQKFNLSYWGTVWASVINRVVQSK